MQTVGSYLREARESRGIQLEEAANTTRIGKNYLIAIEEERFDKLPSPAYVKGFLRIYAGYLGLSGDEVVAMYGESLNPNSEHQSPVDEADTSVVRSVPVARRVYRWLLPLLLILSVALALYFIYKGENGRQNEIIATESMQQKGVASAPILPIMSSAAIPKSATDPLLTAGNREKPEVGGETQNGIVLKLKVLQDCWLNITIDEKYSQQYNLKAGDLIEWKGEKTFTLDLGNAGGVEAELNGRPLKPFGKTGKTAHVVLKGVGT